MHTWFHAQLNQKICDGIYYIINHCEIYSSPDCLQEKIGRSYPVQPVNRGFSQKKERTFLNDMEVGDLNIDIPLLTIGAKPVTES